MKNNTNQLINAFLFIAFSLTVSFSHAQKAIPKLDVYEKSRVDTVTVFDYDTAEETVYTVENIDRYVKVFDTLSVTFDYEKYEETIKGQIIEMSLQEYYNKYGKDRFKLMDEYARYMNQKEGVGKDTIHVFDYDTYEETVSVVNAHEPCYYFAWGNRHFIDSHIVDASLFKKMWDSNFVISALKSDDCEKVEGFSFRMIVVSPEVDPMIIHLDQDRKSVKKLKLKEAFTQKGTKVFFEDIAINGQEAFGPIVITLD